MDGNRQLEILREQIRGLENSLNLLEKYNGNTLEKAQKRAQIEYCRQVLQAEEDYRQKHDELTENYYNLSTAYKQLEAYVAQLNSPYCNDEMRRIIAEEINLLSEELPTDVSPDLDVLRAKLEEIAFERNKLDGIVDDEVVARDKANLINESPDFFALEYEKNEKELKEKEDACNELEKLLNELKTRIESLNNLSTLSLSEDKKKELMEKLNKEINKLGLRIKELLKMLGIKIEIDLDNPDSINLDELNQKLEEKKENIRLELIKLPQIKDMYRKTYSQRMMEILEKYEITKEELATATIPFDTLIDKKVAQIRSRFNELHTTRIMQQDVNRRQIAQPELVMPRREEILATPAASVAPAAPAAPSIAPAAPSVAPAASSAPVAPSAPAAPSVASTAPVTAPVAPAAHGKVVQPPQATHRNADMSAPRSNLPVVVGKNSKVLSTIPVGFNLKAQINQPGMQKIDNGVLYRFEKDGDKLNYIAEDVNEKYLKNPSKALKVALYEFRGRMKKEMGKKEFNEMYTSLIDSVDEQKQELASLLQGTPIFRKDPIDKFVNNLAKKAGPLAQAEMAMAFNSAVLPEDMQRVVETAIESNALGSNGKYNFYTHPSDLNVVMEERKVAKTWLPKFISKRLQPKLKLAEEMTLIPKDNLFTRTSNTIIDAPLENGGLRPFKIEYVEPRISLLPHEKDESEPSKPTTPKGETKKKEDGPRKTGEKPRKGHGSSKHGKREDRSRKDREESR